MGKRQRRRAQFVEPSRKRDEALKCLSEATERRNISELDRDYWALEAREHGASWTLIARHAQMSQQGASVRWRDAAADEEGQ